MSIFYAEPGTVLTAGKTKQIIWTGEENNGAPIVEFVQTGSLVTANGTSTIAAENPLLINQYFIQQNDHIFTFLNLLGFDTTYVGRTENGLRHEWCEPYLLEFVWRRAVPHKASIIAQRPDEFGAPEGYEGSMLSRTRSHPRNFNEDGTIVPLDAPIMDTFLKQMLIEKPDGTVDLIPESKAKKDPRYFHDGTMTQYAHEDPLLILSSTSPSYSYSGYSRWNIFDQKKSVLSQVRGLAHIHVHEGDGEAVLWGHQGKKNIKIRELSANEYVDYKTNKQLQNTTAEIMRAIQIAALMTDFQKAELKGNKVVLGDRIGGAFIMDGKIEYGRVKDITGKLGAIKATDDLLNTNLRWAIGWRPDMSFRGNLFQNASTPEKLLLAAAMVAEGTKRWTDPIFVKSVKFILDQGRGK